MKTRTLQFACIVIALLINRGYSQGTNLIQNGGFEQPNVAAGSWLEVFAPNSFTGWTVDLGAVDVVHTSFYASAAGTQSLDLNHYDSGSVYQTVQTTAGQTYRLTFSFAANPNEGPRYKQMEVRWNDTVLAVLQHYSATDTSGSVHWRTFGYTVVGTGSDKLSFRSLTAGTAAGPAIDEVSLIQLGGLQAPVGNVTIERSVRVSWPSLAGHLYQVQWTTDLTSNAWTDFGSPIAGDGSTQSTYDVIETVSRRFYRVLESQ